MPRQTPSARVLIVDDDQGLLRLLQRALEREGLVTATASSGREALNWLGENSADLMLVDLKLPDLEGRELVNTLNTSGRDVPFIIITGHGDERVAVDMIRRGALDYVVKDVQFIELVPAVVRHALDQLAQKTRLAQAEEAMRRSEAMLARAQEIAHVGSYEIHLNDPDADRWSAETFRILGLDPAARKPRPEEYISRIVHPDDQARVREAFERVLQDRSRFDLEYRIVRSDGSIRHVHGMAEPTLGDDRKVAKLVGTLQDITKRKELEEEILRVSEREQGRIGQDLHDGLCQHLAGIEFRLLGLKQQLERGGKRQAAEATELARLIREGIEQTRTLARGLSPVMLAADGLMNALHELSLNTEQMFKVSCSFNCPAPVLVQDNGVATHLYRIAQEAVHNAIRHGKAKYIVINLLIANGRIILGVKDDGVGLPTRPTNHNGMGLRVMQYRSSMVGGSLVVQHDPGGGTSVICSLRLG